MQQLSPETRDSNPSNIQYTSQDLTSKDEVLNGEDEEKMATQTPRNLPGMPNRVIDMQNYIDNSSASLSQNSSYDFEQEPCILCEKNVKDSDFPDIVNKALYRKYCSNLNNYFYLKDIKRILNNRR